MSNTEIVRSAAELAPAINVEWERAEQSAEDAVAHAIACGGLLDEAKKSLSHGEWLPWLEQNFAGGTQRASEFRRLWQHYGPNSRDPGNVPRTLEVGLKAIATGRTVREPRASREMPIDPESNVGVIQRNAAVAPAPADGEDVVDAEVIEFPAALSIDEERRYVAALGLFHGANASLREACDDHLEPAAVVDAVRDAARKMRRASVEFSSVADSLEKRA